MKENDKEKHIIWDWNGTLLNDVTSAVAALNKMLALRGIPPTTSEFYRENFGFPVRPFYAKVGVDLEHEEWNRICVDFHRFVNEEPKILRSDAMSALSLAREKGMRQSILSALREDMLLHDVKAAGVSDFLDAVYGVDNLDGATKLSRGQDLLRHIKAIRGATEFFFVGDTLHDAEVAKALGARCILVAGGHQSSARLAAAGVPVADSLVAAVGNIAESASAATS